MTTEQILSFVAIASDELLREIVASPARTWAWHKFHARRELARRDRFDTLGHDA